jgi:hypothetical protein
MDVTHALKRGVVGLATTAVVSMGLGAAGMAVAGTAQAWPGPAPETTWCPGQNKPATEPWPGFYATGCHHYHGSNQGLVDEDTGIVHPFPALAPAPPRPPNWCPGDPIPGGFAPQDVDWDPTVCHVVKFVPDPGSLVVQDDGNDHVVAGDPNPSCPLRARLSILPCL